MPFLFLAGRERHSDCLALVQAPRIQTDPQLTLPLDINNYLMTKYIRTHFRVNVLHANAHICIILTIHSH